MKNRLPRKQKKRLKKAINRYRNNFHVFHRAFMDELTYGVSAIHVDKKTGEIKNVPINETLNLLYNAKV